MFDWTTGSLMSRWDTDLIQARWTMSFSEYTLSRLSTEYILIPVAATNAGKPYNPGADTVQFAFMPNAVQQPSSGDWVSGSWETVSTNFIYPYNAKCLVGPAGNTVLTTGQYVVYLKITDSPEIPVTVCGQLVVS
jgi:hypothetical protein